MKKAKVLFFSADPNSAPPHGHAPRLLLDEEVREIHEKVRKGKYRDDLDLDTRWATRADDLLAALGDTTPQVVHFSGHGGSGGLVLVGSDASREHSVDAGQLARLFELFRGDIRLVVLNACFSLPQAEAVAAVVGCAIGTRTEISDAAAIIFSASLYRAIASGCSVGAAFEAARMALDLNPDPEIRKQRDYLQLATGPGVDPTQLFVIEPSSGVPDASRDGRAGKPRWAWGAAAVLTLGVVAALNLPRDRQPEPLGCSWAGSPRPLMASTGSSVAPSTDGGSPAAVSELDRAKLDYEAGRYAAAFPRFRRFAQSGNPEAMGFVGVMFLRGQGTTANSDSGIYWLREAAYKDDPHGMTELGSAYQHGDGVKLSGMWAQYWLTKAADGKRWAEAMRQLGRYYQDQHNYDAAIARYRDAMLAGSREARVDAGQLYEQGQGTAQDLETARCLYRTAAEAGSFRGMFIMGRIYQNGIGVSPDYRVAEEWYRKAAEHGSPDGMKALGELYLDGLGVPRDTAQAEVWFGKAKNAGYRSVEGSPAFQEAD